MQQNSNIYRNLRAGVMDYPNRQAGNLLHVENLRWHILNVFNILAGFENLWQVDGAAKAFNISSAEYITKKSVQ